MARFPVYIVRHGESESNADPEIGSWVNPGLTGKGVKQVTALAERLENELDQPVLLVTSDMKRAVETAKIIGDKLSVSPSLDAGLREYDYGFSPEVSKEEADKLRVEPSGKPVYWQPYPNGETVRGIFRRAGETMTRLLEAQDKTMIIISHSFIIDKILTWWIGYPEEELPTRIFFTRNASLTKLGYTPSGERGLLYVNETSHLVEID